MATEYVPAFSRRSAGRGVLAHRRVRLPCERWGSWAHEAGPGLGLGRLGWCGERELECLDCLERGLELSFEKVFTCYLVFV